jgi:pimeloyl-ACP methyl ester carboxylesterase
MSPRATLTTLVSLAIALAGCTSSSTTGTETSTSAPPATSDTATTSQSATSSIQEAALSNVPRFKSFVACDDNRAKLPWECSTIDVPLDRSDPKSATIPIRVWALPHSDTTTPEGPPLFLTPGGPGEEGLANDGLFFMQKPMRAHHDMIAIDPRGTGRSAAIDCPPMQKGFTTLKEAYESFTACGQQLGPNADRYGAADRILDLEDVRTKLGYDKIFFHGESAASTDAIAYAARFPQHLAALVFDSGYDAMTPDDYYKHFVAHGLLDVADGMCSDDPTCAADTTPAHVAIEWLITTVRQHPIVQSGQTIDPTRVAQLTDADALRLTKAARAAKTGDVQPLIGLAAEFPSWVSGDQGPATGFSQGAFAAVSCNDNWTPWSKTDPVAVRRQKLTDALAALPNDYFAPWTTTEWVGYQPLEGCIEWPAPDRYEPPHPDGFTLNNVPTLILAGDREPDSNGSRQLLHMFPQASFRIVHGAQHPALSAGDCAATYEAQFLDTLTAPTGDACTTGG